MVSVTVIGVPAVAAMLKKADAETKLKIVAAIREVGGYMMGQVSNSIFRGTNAPKAVDTGFFGRSILDVYPSPFVVSIGTNKYPVEYAKFIEYGTSKMSARPHLRNTAKKEERRVKEFFEKKLRMLK